MDKLLKVLRIAVPAVFIVLLVLYLPKIRVENSLERWVTPSSPEIARYGDFLERFGGAAVIGLGGYASILSRNGLGLVEPEGARRSGSCARGGRN
ncbi:MAG: hypothetical protein IMZ46_05815 [Acidobacteria bacterium]|nr:hypothetical protein [Acidobacteriota bacterium]